MQAPAPPHRSHALAPSAGSKGSRWIFAAIALGFCLRVALVHLAEHQLDCDESTVALMSLDILELGARPMFFYGGSYNGGAAVEAYLGALIAALFGYSPIGLKWVAVLLWTAGALVFGDLCRRQLPPAQAIGAVAFLCLGTPFFLEWSTTARGGFGEALLFSALLLWLARPPWSLLRSARARSIAFGLTAGIALWTSEMMLPMLPFAGAWLLLDLPPDQRRRAGTFALAAFALGLLPLAVYNMTHDWQQLRQSAVAGLFSSGGGPLSADQLVASAHFVLGWASWLLVGGAVIGAMRVALRRRPLTLAHLLLAHAIVYGLAYWLSGVRFLEIPPSRVLYPLHLNLAVLLAAAVDLSGVPSQRHKIARSLSTLAIVLWLGSTSTALTLWAATGKPRADGSWRASWCSIDGDGLRSALDRHDIDVVFTNYWTATPLALANRVARRNDPDATRIVPATRLPENPRPGQSAAVALHRDSPLLPRIEASLKRREIEYDLWHWDAFAILSGLDATRLRAVDLALPAALEKDTMPPAPPSPDGFN